MGVVLACNGFEVIDLGVMVPCEKIIETAIAQKVDIIGLSGLITPSLDEMSHIATEMERHGLKVPLLIGGATTSPLHTALKISPKYSGGVIYVKDASQASSIAADLMNPTKKEILLESIKVSYAKAIEKHSAVETNLISLTAARANRLRINWNGFTIPEPNKKGVTVLKQFPLAKLRDFIDWTFFFQAWELRGKYPQILTDPVKGKEASKLFADANALLDKIVADNLLTANGVMVLLPAASEGDDIITFENDTRRNILAKFPQLRNQEQKPDGEPNLCLSDFVAPAELKVNSWLGIFAVSAGIGADELASEYNKKGDDYSALMVKLLADRLAEAFAEVMHEKVRREIWGYTPSEQSTLEEMLKENYQGIRPAPGYPACPDHRQKATIFSILNAKENASIELTESMAMVPAAAVSGYYFAHPQSKYFNVGKIDREQLEDYSKRMNSDVNETTRFIPKNSYL